MQIIIFKTTMRLCPAVETGLSLVRIGVTDYDQSFKFVAWCGVIGKYGMTSRAVFTLILVLRIITVTVFSLAQLEFYFGLAHPIAVGCSLSTEDGQIHACHKGTQF
jgi:hypothetical protein